MPFCLIPWARHSCRTGTRLGPSEPPHSGADAVDTEEGSGTMELRVTYTRRGEPGLPAYAPGTNAMVVEADSQEEARRIVAGSVEDLMEINTIEAYGNAEPA